jgi:DNA helicase-2/ATP-dependent DNA helicase PcrA
MCAAINWSSQQEDIFSHLKDPDAGNLVVLARAGTGKTTTILHGITLAPEDKKLLAAFNKNIATELQKKIPGNCGAEAKTLHALGFGLVKNNWPDANLDMKLPFDQKRGIRLIGEVTSSIPRSVRGLCVKLLDLGRQIVPFAEKGEDLIDVAYSFELIPDDKAEAEGWDVERICNVAAAAMEIGKEKTDVIDFTDMLWLPVVNGWATPRYGLVCIDEAQDMNQCQLELAQRVCKKDGRIVVVGDDRQAIYGFRGADSGALGRLKVELDAAVLPLTITYRCPKSVVAEAQRLVPDYEAAPGAPEGIVRSINIQLIAQNVKAGNFVLSRTNAALAKVCLELIRNHIPAKIQGKDIGRRLDTIAKNISGNNDGLKLEEFAGLLTEWANSEISKALKAEREAYAGLVADQSETLHVLSEGRETVRELRALINDLFGDIALQRGQVICSTVHKAKGLESDTVFILRDTLYPYEGADKVLEENNIEYVAITRAKKELVWVNGKL